MQLTFLEAKVPLTKGYEKKSDGSFVGGMYPGVTFCTSIVEEIDGPKNFLKAMKKHSAAGHCLLTNSLIRPIVMESRAKLSNRDELREWILLDIDGIEKITDVEDFIKKCLPRQFHTTSYILQHSPSSGIKPGVRAHLFFLLEDPVDAVSVSAWLRFTNLDTQLLSDQVTLSKNAMTLSLKLDWVANNNGRIVYITPPNCENFSDPVKKRITLVEKKYEKLSFNFAAVGSSQMRVKVREKLNELRTDAGLPVSRKTEYYKIVGDREVVVDALVEPARITSFEVDNDRFMRCNLDGGDSFAYYYMRNNPTYLDNHKGEPAVKLKLLDPEFYARVALPDMEKLREKDQKPFVFRDHATDKFFAGVRKENAVVLQPTVIGSEKKIEDFYVQFGSSSPPANVETWDRLFIPTSDKQWDADNRVFNTWCQTEYQANAESRLNPPAFIDKLIRHVLNNDKEAYEHFINWLAYIYQKRTKSGTAWVLHGTPGTGKGVLYNYVICPIFGHDYCETKQIRHLKDKFDGWMENALFVNIDEANADDAGYEAKEVINAVKQQITDPYLSVRHMQATAVKRNSYINFIFTTNDFGVLPIQDGDRRFNVAPRQETPLVCTDDDISGIKNELQDFAGFLQGYRVNELRAHTPLRNRAKEELKLAAESSIDAFFRAARSGDLRYFVEGLNESTNEHEALSNFRLAVDQWIDDAKHERSSMVTETQLKYAHIVLCRDKHMKQGAFRKMCAHRGYPVRRKNIAGDRWAGWLTPWKMDEDLQRDLKLHLKSVPTDAEIEEQIKSEITD